MRIISVSYFALVDNNRIALTEDGAQFYPVDEILEMAEELAFDHHRIIACGRERIRTKVNWSDIAFALMPEEFTLPQLQTVYEILLGQKLYKANFRKKLQEKIVETDKMTSGDAHRPSRIYRKKTQTV
jgi:8-oxo-dGTP diphosphatase